MQKKHLSRGGWHEELGCGAYTQWVPSSWISWSGQNGTRMRGLEPRKLLGQRFLLDDRGQLSCVRTQREMRVLLGSCDYTLPVAFNAKSRKESLSQGYFLDPGSIFSEVWNLWDAKGSLGMNVICTRGFISFKLLLVLITADKVEINT